MTFIHIVAQERDMAQSLMQALQPLWPQAQWMTDNPDGTQALMLVIDGVMPEADPAYIYDLRQQAPIRLASVIQALKQMAARQEVLDLGLYRLDVGQREWHDDQGEITALTEKEVDILLYLARIHPQTASREDILRDVWKYAEGADTHTLETHLYRLRQKIEKNPSDPTIVVSTKQGYMLGVV
jgi:DNA-binding response OmpR family regulator